MPPPPSHRIVAVLPIVEERSNDGITLTLYSLELFTGSIRLRGALASENEQMSLIRPDNQYPFAWPHLPFIGTDERGGTYRFGPGYGSGGARWMEFHARVEVPLADGVPELRLHLAEIQWVKGAIGPDSGPPEDVLTVDWEWVVRVAG